MLYLDQLWSFRSFILGSVKREFQSRYRNSVLGAAWVVLPALAQIIIYTLIFSRLIGARLPGIDDTMGYSIYLCAGIVAWSLHTEVIGRSTSVFLDNANMIKKLLFPRLCLPVIVVVSSLINFSIILGIFVVFLTATGRFPGTSLLALLPLVLLHTLLATGIGMALGVMNVFFRDVGQLTQIVLQFWFWLTPIVYPISILPDSIQTLVALNPMTPIIAAYQQIFLYNSGPEWNSLIPVWIIAGVMMFAALSTYRRNVTDIVDEL